MSSSYPESTRDRLWKGESYPISRTEVDEALTAADVQRVDLIYFLRGYRTSHPLDNGRVVTVNTCAVGNEFGISATSKPTATSVGDGTDCERSDCRYDEAR